LKDVTSNSEGKNMRRWSFLKDNLDLIIILTLYSLLAAISLKYYPNTDVDGISYIHIAQAYATGEWGSATNGYWSPLYSWLMVPFFLSGFTPIYGVYISKVVSLIIGFFTIISIKKLSLIFKMDRIIEIALLSSSIPVILYFALMYNTPDLLIVFVLLIYLCILFNPEYSLNWTNGILCGFIGAAAYLTKSYAFPFFIVHFLIFNLIYYFKDLDSQKKNKILKNMFLGFFIFFMISGLWIGTINEKYGKLTISTSGEYNQALIGPTYTENPTSHIKYPVDYNGLFKPPTNSSTSIWDDPSYMKMEHWSPFASVGDFERQLMIIWENIVFTYTIIESFFIVSIFLIIAMIIFIWRSKAQQIIKERLVYLLITIFIYATGYCFITVVWRYLWFIFIIILIASFYLVHGLYKSKMITVTLRNILLIILIFSFIAEPVYEINLFSSNENQIYNLSNTLQQEYKINGTIASNSKWEYTLAISYYLDNKYYGQTKKTNNSLDLQKELNENKIDYYFVWNNESIPKLMNYREITNGKIEGLKIYSRIEKN
jgi:hypothetical protein